MFSTKHPIQCSYPTWNLKAREEWHDYRRPREVWILYLCDQNSSSNLWNGTHTWLVLTDVFEWLKLQVQGLGTSKALEILDNRDNKVVGGQQIKCFTWMYMNFIPCNNTQKLWFEYRKHMQTRKIKQLLKLTACANHCLRFSTFYSFEISELDDPAGASLLGSGSS